VSSAVENLAVLLLAFAHSATTGVKSLIDTAVASQSAAPLKLRQSPFSGIPSDSPENVYAGEPINRRVVKDSMVMSAVGRRRYGSAAAVSRRNTDMLKVSKSRGRWRSTLPVVEGDVGPAVRYTGSGFRLVRCMPHLKRREADAALSAGRVLVNGSLVRPSVRVKTGDIVTLDGKVMNWEPFAEASESDLHDKSSRFAYLKYNKPRGVTCTMEENDPSSMHYALAAELSELGTRLFPVGRLDKHSSGLVLLTDDGCITQALLDPASKAEKEYEVDLDKVPTDDDMDRLASGVQITTRQQRGGAVVTASTLPCQVTRIQGSSEDRRFSDSEELRRLSFVLQEGRNRQIRKMCTSLGFQVNRLHRTRINNIRLGSLQPGELSHLSAEELAALQSALSAQSQAREEVGSTITA